MEKFAWSRIRIFAATGAIARKILQQWAPVDGFSCFAGLE